MGKPQKSPSRSRPPEACIIRKQLRLNRQQQTCFPIGMSMMYSVSVRDGHWDPLGGEDCDPGPGTVMSGAFVYDNRDVMQDYTYMADHMGNIAALVDGTPTSPTHGTARRQVFDAFGNNIGGYITFRCASDHDWTDNPWRRPARNRSSTR